MTKQFKIGFTASCFDLFHAGHVSMLQEAKSVCDHLIVGLQADPTLDRPQKNKPVQTLLERQIQVYACKYVDQVIVYNTEDDLLALLNSTSIEVRIIGEEYRDCKFTGDHLPIVHYFNKRQHEWSSTSIRKRILESCENK